MNTQVSNTKVCEIHGEYRLFNTLTPCPWCYRAKNYGKAKCQPLKKSRLKKQSKGSITEERTKLVAIAKIIAKQRDNYTCQRCGRSRDQGWKIDGSHVIAESQNRRMSYDPQNIKALCTVCHRWWHLNPTEAGKWFRDKFPQRMAYLEGQNKETCGKGNITRPELEEAKNILQEIICSKNLPF